MPMLKIGRLVLIGGLAAQVGTFMIFLIVAIAFDLKTRRLLGSELKAIRPLIWAFYASAALIIIRSIYRTIGKAFSVICGSRRLKPHLEFSQIDFTATKEEGYVVDHEWLFYVFDALLILVSVHCIDYIPQVRLLITSTFCCRPPLRY
jgi:hypothetical protein